MVTQTDGNSRVPVVLRSSWLQHCVLGIPPQPSLSDLGSLSPRQAVWWGLQCDHMPPHTPTHVAGLLLPWVFWEAVPGATCFSWKEQSQVGWEMLSAPDCRRGGGWALRELLGGAAGNILSFEGGGPGQPLLGEHQAQHSCSPTSVFCHEMGFL